MRKIYVMMLVFTSIVSTSLFAASSQKKGKFEVSVGSTFVNMASTQQGTKSVSEIVVRAVPEVGFEYRPSWYAVKVSALIGNTSTYDLGGASEMMLPTLLIKGYMSFVYLGVGGYYQSTTGSYEYVSGSTKTAYTVSSSGPGPVVELGLKSPVFFGGLAIDLGVQYTPLSKIEIAWSANDKTISNKTLVGRAALNYSF